MCCPSREFVGAVGRVVKSPRVAFTPDTAAHTAKDSMVAAALAFDCGVAEAAGSGFVDEVAIWETAATGSPAKAGIRLFFLRANQTGLTANVAYASPATVTDIIGYVDVAAADFIDIDSTHAMAVVQPGLNIRPTAGQTIYVVPVALGTNTYAASASLAIELRIISD